MQPPEERRVGVQEVKQMISGESRPGLGLKGDLLAK